ncbi:hypothetical protein KM043_009417 [Ampulex compressa]|nr:hypothetical protein KM043_009417 [Ampulex compressa]
MFKGIAIEQAADSLATGPPPEIHARPRPTNLLHDCQRGIRLNSIIRREEGGKRATREGGALRGGRSGLDKRQGGDSGGIGVKA